MRGLRGLPSNYVHCIVTSVPYWNLRDYGVEGQLGLEETPDEFVAVMVELFREARRVLRDDGTLWLNIGDSYARTGGTQGGGNRQLLHMEGQQKRMTKLPPGDIKAKDLVGIPWMLAFALRSDGWYLRQDIIWHKPNPMPESINDRCTKSHEYIFLLSKTAMYYYNSDAIATPVGDSTDRVKFAWGRAIDGSIKDVRKGDGAIIRKSKTKSGNKMRKSGFERGCPENNGVSNLPSHVPWEGTKANKRSVWTIATQPLKEAHFATFPEQLPATCIKAGCPIGGIVLDMFMGAGTTALVARKLQRNFIGFDLNPQYIEIAEQRLQTELGTLFT